MSYDTCGLYVYYPINLPYSNHNDSTFLTYFLRLSRVAFISIEHMHLELVVVGCTPYT